MTNEQLRVLILNYAQQLEDALDGIKDEHPELCEGRKTIVGTFPSWPLLEPVEDVLGRIKAGAEVLTTQPPRT